MTTTDRSIRRRRPRSAQGHRLAAGAAAAVLLGAVTTLPLAAAVEASEMNAVAADGAADSVLVHGLGDDALRQVVAARAEAAAAEVAEQEAMRERELAARREASQQARQDARQQARQEARAEERRIERVRAERAASRAAERAALDPRGLARTMMADRYGWGEGEFQCLDALWMKESGWNPTADNPSSDAYGIPQALPGSKMSSHGADWATNPATQISWGLDYISQVYGSPCGAWGHSQSVGWY
jgi:molybdopterin-guanine dinucleotide biosynthesis protein